MKNLTLILSVLVLTLQSCKKDEIDKDISISSIYNKWELTKVEEVNTLGNLTTITNFNPKEYLSVTKEEFCVEVGSSISCSQIIDYYNDVIIIKYPNNEEVKFLIFYLTDKEMVLKSTYSDSSSETLYYKR